MKRKTISLLIIAMLASSFAAIFVKWSQAPATIISMYRMYLACVLLAPMAWIHRHQWAKLNLKEWGYLVLAGILLATHFALWFESLKLTTVASSMIITALQPLVALLGGYFIYHETTNIHGLLAIGISILGIAFVAWGDFGQHHLTTLLGDLLSFLCIIALVSYMLIGQHHVKEISFWTYSFSVFLIAGVTLNLFNLVTQTPIGGYSGHDWHIFWLLAIFPTAAHVIYNYLLKYVNTTVISMSMLGEPVGATLLAIPLLGEVITFWQLVGGLIVLGGIILYLRH